MDKNFNRGAAVGVDYQPCEPDENLQRRLVGALNNLRHRELDSFFSDGSAEPGNMLRSYFGFAIGGEEFVVDAQHFCEVFTDIPIAPLPNSPVILMGLVNLRGLLLPVYQLHQYLQLNKTHISPFGMQKVSAVRKKVVLVIGKGERAIGLLIDSLPTSLTLALSSADYPGQATSVPHPLLMGLAQIHMLPDKTLSQLQVEQLPERLLDMANEVGSQFQ